MSGKPILPSTPGPFREKASDARFPARVASSSGTTRHFNPLEYIHEISGFEGFGEKYVFVRGAVDDPRLLSRSVWHSKHARSSRASPGQLSCHQSGRSPYEQSGCRRPAATGRSPRRLRRRLRRQRKRQEREKQALMKRGSRLHGIPSSRLFLLENGICLPVVFIDVRGQDATKQAANGCR